MVQPGAGVGFLTGGGADHIYFFTFSEKSYQIIEMLVLEGSLPPRRSVNGTRDIIVKM